jgi:hypothetical protein
MKLFYEWIYPHIRPRIWMCLAYYSVERNQELYVVPPLNLLIAVAWWAQDKWARHAHRSSWIEEELRRRNQTFGPF